jgi:hypothetical protein
MLAGRVQRAYFTQFTDLCKRACHERRHPTKGCPASLTGAAPYPSAHSQNGPSGIAFAIEQPADVDIGEIVIRPTAQG